jgi:membrane protein
MQIRRFFRTIGRRVVDDQTTNIAAELSFWAVLALFPMLLFVVALAMLVLPHDWIERGASTALEAMPGAVRTQLASRIRAFMSQPHGWFALLGAALALWSARGGVTSLMTALDAIFRARETRSWLRRQLIALAVTVVIAVLIVIAFAVLVIGPLVGHFIVDRLGLGGAFDTAWSIARWVVAALIMMAAWAILYRFLPDTKAPFRVFTPGAVVGVIVWIGASVGFSAYLSHFDRYEATYGALGGAIIFLTWLWLSNMALVLGAEIDVVVAEIRAPHDEGAAKLAA